MLAVLLGLPVTGCSRHDTQYAMDSPWSDGHRGTPRPQGPVSVGLIGRRYAVRDSQLHLWGAFYALNIDFQESNFFM